MATWPATCQLRLLRSCLLLGFQWWLFEDWAGVNNGLVDYGTLEPKGNALSAQQIGKFVAPVVVLLGNGTLWHPSPAGDSGSFGYRSGEAIEPELLVSNYAPTALSGCALKWKVHSSSRRLLHNGTLSIGAVAQGTVKSAVSRHDIAGIWVAFFSSDIAVADRGALPLRCPA